ncbi:MAG TPA: hypothetical protein VER12_02010 [Polyangiaceae bacterium]|nr:hypothetical protein [Polyangiaceae bacterium]
MFDAGVPAPGGLSGVLGDDGELSTGALPSLGMFPLSGVVLPVVELAEGSVGGGLEPPQAESEMAATSKRLEVVRRFIVFSSIQTPAGASLFQAFLIITRA